MRKTSATAVVIAIIILIAGYIAYLHFRPSFTLEIKGDQTLVTNRASGISIMVPTSADILALQDGSTSIVFGDRYHASLGYSATTTRYLQEIFGVDSILLGTHDSSDPSDSLGHCSTTNFPTGSLSKETVDVKGHSFLVTYNTDQGMGSYQVDTRYAEFLGEGCRFAIYSDRSHNPRAYWEGYFEESHPVYISIQKELGAGKKTYSFGDFKESISIRNP